MKMDAKKRRTLIIVCAIVFLILPQLFLSEYVKKKTTPEVVSKDPQLVLSEMPDVELKEKETALAEVLFAAPELKEIVENKKSKNVEIDAETSEKLFGDVLPEGAKINQTLGFYSLVIIDFTVGRNDLMLGYADTDHDGTIDRIQKGVAVKTPDGQQLDVFYELTADLKTGEKKYEKAQMPQQ